jgi:hypothetical protein
MYPNLKTRLAAVLLVALGAAACGTAVAQAYEGPTWSVGENVVTENVSINSKNVGAFIFEHKGGLLGTLKVECSSGSASGTVGSEGRDKITTSSVTGCKVVEGLCMGSVTATAIHLPWNTQLEEVGAEIRDKLSSSGAGTPGWEFECSGVKLSCSGETTTGINDVLGGVEVVFDSKSTSTSCSDGGTGTVKGAGLDESPSKETQLYATKGIIKFKITPAPRRYKNPEMGKVTIEATGQEEELSVVRFDPAGKGFTILKKSGEKCQIKYVPKVTKCVVEVEWNEPAKVANNVDFEIKPKTLPNVFIATKLEGEA